MGAANSRAEKNEALRLCRERKRFIKVAVDSRYDLAAAHVSYIQSLRNVGVALRRYAEGEVVVESSLSISDKTPSQTSYPSPSSPLHVAEVEVLESPLHFESPISPPVATVNYMRSGGSVPVTVKIDVCGDNENYLDAESTVLPMSPPPPPPPDSGASWDFFEPGEDSESFRFAVHGSDFRECRDEENAGSTGAEATRNQWLPIGSDEKFNGIFSSAAIGNEHRGSNNVHGIDHSIVSRGGEGFRQLVGGGARRQESLAGDMNQNVGDKGGVGRSSSKRGENMAGKNVCAEREDPSEFITHRAKDFLSSIKDIEHRFIRASESGKEVSRLLEANKIKVGYSEAKGICLSSAYDNFL